MKIIQPIEIIVDGLKTIQPSEIIPKGYKVRFIDNVYEIIKIEEEWPN